MIHHDGYDEEELLNDIEDKIGNYGNKKGDTDKLFSTASEELDGSNNKKLEMAVEGEKDGSGNILRETEFQDPKLADKNGDVEKAVPKVALDEDAGISSQQSQDNAIKNTQIPGEYEKIIKGMYIDE